MHGRLWPALPPVGSTGAQQAEPLIHLCHDSAVDLAAVDQVDPRLATCAAGRIRRKAAL